MQIFTISDPNDRENPLIDISGDSLIYHGTSSVFSQRIEEQGFSFGGFKATCGAEIISIVAACEKLYFKPDGFAAASGFSQKNCVYFSVHFHSARAYALNTGGERMDGAIRAASAFVAFANNRDHIARQAAHWEAVLNQHGPHAPTERALFNLRNSELVRRLAEEVEISRSVLRNALTNGKPVVYAVSADEAWIRELSTNAIGDWNKEPFGGIKLTDVPANRIVARIDYPNGISPDSE
ncbi:MAG: hypothetical protein M3410_08020 [Acidobacteriota bacterium]|nr:hypothetical protein [Acidobacteriota bacterium]